MAEFGCSCRGEKDPVFDAAGRTPPRLLLGLCLRGAGVAGDNAAPIDRQGL
jgi:hypothetical protein